MEEKKEKKKHRGFLNILIKVLIVIVIILLILIVIGVFIIKNKLDKIEKEHIDVTQIGITEETKKELAHYRNIALLGIDTRKDDYSLGNRSDCIIIASINEDTKKVKLMSVYRDTYMLIEERGSEKLDKVTHAYSFGGAQNALKALNTNLDLNISEFLTVNFEAVAKAIDLLGGVTIDIDSAELKYINSTITSTSKALGVSPSYINETGYHLLDGVQAVAYSRIRYTEGGDHKRAERMRIVIEAMLDKSKTLSISKLNKVVDEILPRVRTNISNGEIISLIPSITSYEIEKSIGWPYDTKGITLDRWYGVPVTLESNVTELHKKLFNQTDYEASDTVKKISSDIVKKTGYKN